jgi:hypothetical protein
VSVGALSEHLDHFPGSLLQRWLFRATFWRILAVLVLSWSWIQVSLICFRIRPNLPRANTQLGGFAASKFPVATETRYVPPLPLRLQFITNWVEPGAGGLSSGR